MIEYQSKQQITSSQILKDDVSFSNHFVKSAERPQNFIKNVDPSVRYNKYPKTNQLMQQKTALIQHRNHPPLYLKQNLKNFNLQALGKFDLIYCDPPWQQYQNRAKLLDKYNKNPQYYKSWTLQQLSNLPVDKIGDNPSFLFLWVGSDHLDDGRQLFKKWGYKRCQDITWIKTNIKNKMIPNYYSNGIMLRVKQHCLVGFKGDAKKASDHTFIHPNIDIDVVVTQQPQLGSLQKPNEVYDIIERFCLGRKKIELFGVGSNIRNGWVTIGSQLNQSKFDLEQYNRWFINSDGNQIDGFKRGRYLGTTPLIQSLRPRQQIKQQQQKKISK